MGVAVGVPGGAAVGVGEPVGADVGVGLSGPDAVGGLRPGSAAADAAGAGATGDVAGAATQVTAVRWTTRTQDPPRSSSPSGQLRSRTRTSGRSGATDCSTVVVVPAAVTASPAVAA